MNNYENKHGKNDKSKSEFEERNFLYEIHQYIFIIDSIRVILIEEPHYSQ